MVDGQRRSAALMGVRARALEDLDADFTELLFVCDSAQAELAEAAVELGAADLQPLTADLLARQLAAARRRYRSAAARLHSLRGLARSGAVTLSLVESLAAEKVALADLLRVEQAMTAALVAAADWQSPSFGHSTAPAAGRQSGRIRAHCNDYKRDRHLDADAYERRYVAAMVDGPPGLKALLTSCGMAAFTTILSFLWMDGRLERPVLAGAGLYHESRLLLQRALSGRVQIIDERDTPALVRAIDQLHPSAIFLDSLSNTNWMPVPDLPSVIERLTGTDTYLVVDNTGLSVSCQAFALAGDSVRLIVFESLLKYAQLGLDRANAGVIVARREDAAELDRYREHLGTNIADVAVHALPRPDRCVLQRRLARLQRNALLLAGRLHDRVGASVNIVYPGLASHPSARASPPLAFRGACLSIAFRERDPELRREHALVERAIAEAAKRGVALLAGSSFGFDTTRIYLTATRPDDDEPFVRISAGTEHAVEIERLADALAAAVLQVV